MSDSTLSLSRQDVLNAVYGALDTLNELRAADEQLTKSPDLVLLGSGSTLDSLAFTTLVLAVERNVEDLAGASIDLLSSASDPTALKTVGAIVDLILRRLAE